MDGARWCSNAFGLGLRSELPLVGMTPSAPTKPVVAIGLAGSEAMADAWPGARHTSEGVLPDGCRCIAERGAGGQLRITYGERAVYQLSADALTLLCSPAELEEPTWQRFLLDAVLLKASEANGLDALHASAVEAPAGVVAFATQAGGGKSSLASELVRRGYAFFADDALAIRRDDDMIRAYPAPPLMNFPLDHPERFAPTELGTVQAIVGAEAWLAVRHAATAPGPVAAVYLLDRRPGLSAGLDLLAPSPAPLLPHVLGDTGSRARVACRFELLCDLVATTTIYRLHADPATPVGRLADLVEESL